MVTDLKNMPVDFFPPEPWYSLPGFAESSLKINQSFHVLTNQFENLPDYGNFVPTMLSVILNISCVLGQNLP